MGHFYCTTRIDNNILKFEIMFNCYVGHLEYFWGCAIKDKCDLIDIHRLTHLFEKFNEDVCKYAAIYGNPRKNEKSRTLFLSEIVDVISKKYFDDICCSRCLHYDWEPKSRKMDYTISDEFKKKIKETQETFKKEWE